MTDDAEKNDIPAREITIAEFLDDQYRFIRCLEEGEIYKKEDTSTKYFHDRISPNLSVICDLPKVFMVRYAKKYIMENIPRCLFKSYITRKFLLLGEIYQRPGVVLVRCMLSHDTLTIPMEHLEMVPFERLQTLINDSNEKAKQHAV